MYIIQIVVRVEERRRLCDKNTFNLNEEMEGGGVMLQRIADFTRD